ncbi:Uncharacterised protein [Vibrio cholerae]|nr:Uncharacterised protein [Vibrio cholerae]CSI72624.1 Uncharacterised protein [Vibrio cholerae]CSI86384.1 Uncharacterised protein [Vibrio cholerae]
MQCLSFSVILTALLSDFRDSQSFARPKSQLHNSCKSTTYAPLITR